MAAGSSSTLDVAAAIRKCAITPWTGTVWRCHGKKYAGDDATGSLFTTGRFNRGSDQFAVDETWPALYAGMERHVALGERIRHTTPENLNKLASQRFSCLRVDLQAVLMLCAPGGCADLAIDDVKNDDLCRPADYRICHQVAACARSVAEAMIVPSCTKFREGNLIVFPDRLTRESSLAVESTEDPDLFIDWTSIKGLIT